MRLLGKDEKESPIKTEGNDQQKHRLLKKEFYVRHFTGFMGLLTLIGALIVTLGTIVPNYLIVSLGTTIFSAAILGSIFKVLGYDVYLLTVMRDIIYEHKFLDRLTEKELRTVIRKTLEAFRKRKIADDIYGVFENHLIDELAGISKNQCTFKVDLSFDNSLNAKLVLGRSLLNYDVHNESKEKKPLFNTEGEVDLVTHGSVTIPEQLKPSQIPNDPTVFWNLDGGKRTGLRLNTVDLKPDVNIKWANENNHSEGVVFEVRYKGEIDKNQKKNFELKTRCLYSTHDYIVKRFSGFSRNFIVLVTKPDDLDVSVIWFLTAKGKEPEATQHPADIKDSSYFQKVEGILVPGNGFVVIWWPKRRAEEPKKIGEVDTAK